MKKQMHYYGTKVLDFGFSDLKSRKFHLLLLALVYSCLTFAQTAKGTVRDGATGEVIIGASVVEVGVAGNGTITDLDGNFSLALKGENPSIIVSYVGFESAELLYTGQENMVIDLKAGTLLDEVVVTALGVNRQEKALGYAVTQIESSDLTKTQVTNFASALYGKAPGVSIRSVPGGATSGVNINIRGFGSITGNTQPLIVMDGVPIRNGEQDRKGYWGDQRIRGNGLTDINPDDIESISVLKGASAAALYGSEATNGVILITSKKGSKARGLGVTVNASYNNDRVAYLPRYQNVRGPGYPTKVFDAGQDDLNFLMRDSDGDGEPDTRGLISTTLNFGPEFDGQPVLAWTGEVVPYVAAESSYADFFQPAQSSNVNVAVSNGTDRSDIRFSFSRQDNKMISFGSQNTRNIANLNTNFHLGDKLTTSVNIKYINQNTKNRPYKVDRLINNFNGMMDRFENADWYFDKFQTSLGYRYRNNNQASLTPEENITVPGSKGDILDYMWRLHKLNSEENDNRIIANLTQSWEIVNGLTLRGRLGTDYTASRVENKNATQNPSVLYTNPGGSYSLGNTNQSLVYGDALLTFVQSLTQDLSLTLMGGYTAQRDSYYSSTRSTNGGLTPENFFALAGSINSPLGGGAGRWAELRDAVLGTANLDYKGWAFIEGTIRRDRTSRIRAENNAFVYPSVNASLILNEAFELPRAIQFAKLRASYGIVGNYPGRYQANVAYNQRSLGVQEPGGIGILYTDLGGSYGNDAIRPEQKREFEIGLVANFLTRFSIDASYYNGLIVDQILPVTLPASQGFGSVLTNIGTLRNAGVEIALDADIVKNTDFEWNARVNFAKNTNTVVKLANEATELVHNTFDGGAAQIKSTVGRPMGDILARPVLTTDDGRRIVNPNGTYQLDGDTWEVYGNAMPDFEGGVMSSVNYRGITLDVITDFSVGGAIMPTGLNWIIGRGQTEQSLEYPLGLDGGLSYYVDENNKGIQTTASTGPNGERVLNDGFILEGVIANTNAAGETTYSPNDHVISKAEYYWRTYNWGGPQYGNARYELFIQDNNWWKVRELALGYALPPSVTENISMTGARVSVYGRNLFFLYRSIKDIDPEQTTSGARWYDNINNAGNNPAFRSFGVQLTAQF